MNAQLFGTLLSTENRAAWLAARKLGSSDAATICGLNPYCSPLKLFLRLVGQTGPEPESEAMRWGNLLEPVIAEEFERRTGLKIERAQTLQVHPDHYWMTTTPDYWCYEGDDRGISEIKNAGFYQSEKWEDGAIPDYAHLQVQHQMAVCDCKFAYVVGLIGGNKLVYRRVERDDAIIAQLIEIEGKFWESVQSKTPPSPQASDSDLLAEMFPKATQGKTLELDAAANDLALAYSAAKAEVKRWEALADRHSARLKDMLKDAEKATTTNYKIEWPNRSRTALDTKSLKIAWPLVWDEFAKTTDFRQFTVKEIKDNGKN
jgi:putative phage-type endonuclease